MNNFTDEERVVIADKEYKDLKVKDEIVIGEKTIGYVSQVNNKITGEQSFIITDNFVSPIASIEERTQVKELTVLYKGSTAPSIGNVLDKNHVEHNDLIKDWLHNDIPTAVQVMNGGGAIAMPQLHSSAKTLKKAMTLYPNAQVFVYGHSLGAMNAQYAMTDLSENLLPRIGGGFFYQGPNVYSILTPTQRTTADVLNKLNVLFNYVDPKDLVPIGYGSEKPTVGNLINVKSNKVGVIDQHMWGGYQFDKEGNILTDKDGSVQLAKYMVSQQLSRIDRMRKKFMKSGGGLSTSEEIFLDASEAMAMTQGMKQTIRGEIAELKQMYKKGIKNAEELWRTTQSNAEGVGKHLAYYECIDALAAGNVTKSTTVTEPVARCEESLAKVIKIEQNYDELLKNISEAITKQLETDQELARQIGCM